MTRHTLYSKKHVMDTRINLSGALLLYEQRGMLSRWMRATYRRINNSKWTTRNSPKQNFKQIKVWDGVEFKRVK